MHTATEGEWEVLLTELDITIACAKASLSRLEASREVVQLKIQNNEPYPAHCDDLDATS